MAQISYRRLQSTLAPDNAVERSAAPALDAWAVVDTLNRLRALINQLPGRRSNSPGLRIITSALKPVEALRHAVQHMDGEIHRVSATSLPLWGAIAWVQQGSGDALRSRMILLGVQLGSMNVPAITPFGKEIESPGGPIELTAASTTISLTDLVKASVTFGRRLAQARERAAESIAPDASDQPLRLDVQAS